jgi:hypothetical protein
MARILKIDCSQGHLTARTELGSVPMRPATQDPNFGRRDR